MSFEPHPYARYIAERAVGPHSQHWNAATHRESPFHAQMHVDGITVEANEDGHTPTSIIRIPSARTRLQGFADLATGEHPHGQRTPYHTLIRNALGDGENVHLFSTGPIEQPVVHVLKDHLTHSGLPRVLHGEIEIHRSGDGVDIHMRNTPHGRELLPWALSHFLHAPARPREEPDE